MTIEVTEDDIKHGVAKDCGKCPIARAIGRIYARSVSHFGARDPLVWLDSADDIEINSQKFVIRNEDESATVARFISNFDYGEPVKPFSFTLEEKEDDDEWD